IQTSRHKDYFVAPKGQGSSKKPAAVHAVRSIPYHAALLLVYVVQMVLLSQQIGVPINHAIQVLRAPPELAGLLVSVLILSPESLSATRAALANELQRSVNILLGSVLASIGLTIPAVLAIGFVTGHEIVLGLGATDTTLLLLTLGLSMLTFGA